MPADITSNNAVISSTADHGLATVSVFASGLGLTEADACDDEVDVLLGSMAPPNVSP